MPFNIKIVFTQLILVSTAYASVIYASGTTTLHKFAGFEMGLGTFTFAEKLDHKIVFPVANLTAGLAYQRFSFVVNASGSMADADVSEEEQVGSAKRKDLDFTMGYQLNKTASMFIGYKSGESNLALLSRDALVAASGVEFYKQNGPYVGINLNWAIEGAGKLAFSVAYAALAADNFFIADGDDVEAGETFEVDDIDEESKGDSTGYSYSLSWSMPMKGNLIFRSRLKINQYQQDITYYDDMTNQTHYFNGVEESSTMLFLGVTSIF